MKRSAIVMAAMLALCAGGAAHAQVTVTFYEHELGDSFPHAFVVIEGTDDATGKAVAGDYGFTAKSVTPALLFGPVDGKLEHPDPFYVRHSHAKFALKLSEDQYRALMTEIGRWQSARQPSYSLKHANCVHFVGALARAVGLRTNPDSPFFRRPRSYLEEVAALNRTRVIAIR